MDIVIIHRKPLVGDFLNTPIVVGELARSAALTAFEAREAERAFQAFSLALKSRPTYPVIAGNFTA